MQHQPETFFLTSEQVRARYHISNATLWRWEHDEAGGFPKPLKLGNKKLYPADALRQWEAARMAASA